MFLKKCAAGAEKCARGLRMPSTGRGVGVVELARGLEPLTFGLQIRCTTSYATQAMVRPKANP